MMQSAPHSKAEFAPFKAVEPRAAPLGKLKENQCNGRHGFLFTKKASAQDSLHNLVLATCVPSLIRLQNEIDGQSVQFTIFRLLDICFGRS